MSIAPTESEVDKDDPLGLLPLVEQLIAAGASLPDEPTDLRWAWRLVLPDLRSTHGYRWPFPGAWATAPDDGRSLLPDDPGDDPCPSERKGGLCLAKTIDGAKSGGMALRTALVCGYLPTDLLGENAEKLRVAKAWVLEVIDPLPWLVRPGADLRRADLGDANLGGAYLGGANLRDAYLGGADLRRANLGDANLGDANLRDANLRGANLGGVNLRGANLGGANLRDADLRGANLRGANLRDADLRGANLGGADLRGANLRDANLGRADLRGANLGGANLGGADLRRANLGGATYTPLTLWPQGFDPVAAGAVLV